MNRPKRKNAANPQNKDFQYLERLAQEMRRTAPFSYDKVDPETQVEEASLDSLSSLIDIEPGSLGVMSGDTMHTINEIKKRSKEIETRQARDKHPQQATYDDLLGIGESFLDLGEDRDDLHDSNTDQPPLNPSELINSIDAVTSMLADDARENIPVVTQDGKPIKDVIIKNGTVILITD